MLSSLRGLVRSKVGAVVAVLFLGILAFLMVSGDVSSLKMDGMSALGGGGELLDVGDTKVTGPEFATRVTQEMEAFRQQQPTIDMAQFVAGGGYDATLQRLINGIALQEFGLDQGMLVSKRAVDGQIASIPGLQGANGQFDPTMFRQLLAERKLTEANVRADIARDLMGRLLTERLLRAGLAPQQLALPYANLSLERRAGEIALVPTSAVAAGPAPTDAEVQAFYARNVQRYTVPERRTVRYARVAPEQVKAAATPTEAEVADAYKLDSAKYAASERRGITQVVVLDQAGAQALAAKVKGGQSLADAARAAGLEPSTLTDLDKATLGQRTSTALADAVFATTKGAVVGPVRGGLGYAVARIDDVRRCRDGTLAQARDEIVAALTLRKTADALNAAHDAIDDKLAGNATFDELVGDRKLTAQSTPALLADGTDPDRPGTPANAALTPLLKAAFQMQEGDEPQMVSTGEDGSFALIALGSVAAAAPRPLAQIRETVASDAAADRARQAARRIAGQILAAVNNGQSLDAAWAAAGVKAPGPHPLTASRDDVTKAQGPTRAPLALMFAMAKGTAKLLEAPGGAGWAIIKLGAIIPGDASRDPMRVAAVRSQFGEVLGREYLEQFRPRRPRVGGRQGQSGGARPDEGGPDRQGRPITAIPISVRPELVEGRPPSEGQGVLRQAQHERHELAAGRPVLLWRRQVADTETRSPPRSS